jgi:hypothetical protein
MKLQNSVITLGLVLTVFFSLAFRCGTPSGTSSEALTESDVKQLITRREKMLATGVGTSPNSADVTFESIKFGTTRTANKQDEFDGVPEGETVYPVRTKYTAHRQWGSGSTEDRETYYDWDFFKNNYGEWDAIGKGPAR